MTPKQKSEQLVQKYRALARYSGGTGDTIPAAKECALIAVDEILNSNPHIYIEIGGSDNRGDWSYKEAQSNQLYWEEVKKEIENYGGDKIRQNI